MAAHVLLKDANFVDLQRGSYVIEIGSQRAPKPPEDVANSTCFLDRLASTNDLEFITVDFSKDSFELARSYVGDKAVHSDGAEFLRNFDGQISILYLDNFDIVYSEKHRESLMARVGSVYQENQETITNERSAQVHLEQLKAALPLLTTPAFVCIDDTMIRDEHWFGKGAKVVPFLLNLGWNKIADGSFGVLLLRQQEPQ